MIPDQPQRDRAVRETRRSFVVEASAGTGKTRTLVDRILHLVLREGPSGPPIRLVQVCAITFTEKAAGEMKIRLRQEFEEATRDEAVRPLAQQALYDLESAAISTFHSLAVSLLKERPIEAGLDPQFTALDEIQSGLLFDELWEEWIRDVLVARRGPIEAALRGGFSLGGLKSIASGLRLHAPLATRLELPPPATEEDVLHTRASLLSEAHSLRCRATRPDDKLLLRLADTIAWLESPLGCAPPGKPGNTGRADRWSGGADTVRQVQDFVRRTAEFASESSGYERQRLLDTVVRWLRTDFLHAWQRRKQAEGVVDFDDQLEAARSLLIRSRAARREFQDRFRTLLVDEFQDTDPTQLDIVLLLSSPGLDENDPSRLKPGPGRLFIVGDPKQSIYRFRGADVETYLDVVGRSGALGLECVGITTNFRSVPSLLRFVDAAFEGVMLKSGDGRRLPGGLSPIRRRRTTRGAGRAFGPARRRSHGGGEPRGFRAATGSTSRPRDWRS